MNKSTIQNSTRELANLEFLSGQLETMDAFAQAYKRMLDECKASKDMATARAMQNLLLRQAEFLMNEWVKEKKAAPAQDSMALMEYGKNN